MKTERRSALKKMFASVLGLAGAGMAVKAGTGIREEKEADNITSFQNAPLFSGHTKFGNLVFVIRKRAVQSASKGFSCKDCSIMS